MKVISRSIATGLTVRITAQTVGLVLLMALLAGCPSGTTDPPKGVSAIAVLPGAFNFGPTQTSDSLAISNIGEGLLLWTVGPTPTWLSVSPANGSTPVGGPTIATLTVDRTGLVPGTYQTQFLVGSNGGNRTISVTLQVAAAPLPPTLQVTPPSLDFGTATTTMNLSVANVGQGTVNWTIDAGLPAWLSAAPASGSVSSAATTCGVTVVRSGLPAGLYSANINFSSDGGNVSIPIQMQVPGPAPLLLISPLSLDFAGNKTELQLSIRNTGTGTLNWTLSESLPWLSLSSTSGSTTSETDVVTVTVDRTGLPSGPLSGVIAASSNGGASNVNVTGTVAPAQLTVTPTTLNFGNFTLNRLFAIGNAGTGTVNWTINTGSFPSWLAVSATSGSVTTSAQAVLATVNRAALAPGNYSHTFTVSSDAGNINVSVFMSVAPQPVLVVDTAGVVNGDGQPLAALGEENTTLDIVIANGGTGTLNWTIDPTTFPSWLTMAPVQGSITALQTNTVTITVSRVGLPTDGYIAEIPVTSNGGNTILDVTMQVPVRPAITATPDSLEFGVNDSAAIFSVANIGDPNTVLNFLVESSDPNWLFNSPSTGTSIGTSSIIKDFKDISVSIDRTGLNGVSQTGFFTISAVDGNGDKIDDIASVNVGVSVQVNPLAFQVGIIRTRIPSMLRFAFVMRDFRNDSFFVAPEALTDPFHIFENGIPVEQPNETTQRVLVQNSILTAPSTDYRIDLREKVALVLDYSGSMKAAALLMGKTIQQAHTEVGTQIITDYFTNLSNVERGFAQMGLFEFHDRITDLNMIHDFTSDPAALITALQNINVADNGATELLPAILAGSDALVSADLPYLEFDDSDIRAVLILTDGRLTTPPGKVQDAIDKLNAGKTRVISIGWGIDVNHQPLAELAAGTGGNYYLTHADNLGNPDIANIEARAAICADDLAKHTLLTYVTLGEGDNVPVRFDGTLDDPNDSPDRGTLQGTIPSQNVKLGDLVGDIKLGQISMRSNGIVGGATRLTVRADYVPRNVNKFQFTLTAPNAYVISKVPLNEGGLVSTWTLTNLGAGTYRLDAPSGEVINYGEFGDLVRLDFAGVGAPFTASLSVDNSIYVPDPDNKYFIYPDTIDIGANPFLAPAIPTLVAAPKSFDFGTAINSTTFTVRNIGGSYPYPNADIYLDWFVQDKPAFVSSVSPALGARISTIGVDTTVVSVDRTLAQGVYTGFILFRYTAADPIALNIKGTVPVAVSIRILPPVLTTSPASPITLNFGNVPQAGGPVSQSFQIVNTGQSTLSWSINPASLPAWIPTIVPISDTNTGETDNVFITVDPQLLPLGPANTTFSVVSNGGTASVTVTINVI